MFPDLDYLTALQRSELIPLKTRIDNVCLKFFKKLHNGGPIKLHSDIPLSVWLSDYVVLLGFLRLPYAYVWAGPYRIDKNWT